MIITNAITLSNNLNITVSNIYMIIDMSTGALQTTGKAQVKLAYWISEAEMLSGATRVFPKIGDDLITDCVIDVDPNEVVKVGTCTAMDTFIFYKTKVAAKLFSLYGWNITIQ